MVILIIIGYLIIGLGCGTIAVLQTDTDADTAVIIVVVWPFLLPILMIHTFLKWVERYRRRKI